MKAKLIITFLAMGHLLYGYLKYQDQIFSNLSIPRKDMIFSFISGSQSYYE